MLKVLEYRSIQRNQSPSWLLNAKLNYLASDIMEMLAITDTDETALSIDRAFQACRMLHIPVSLNFHRVFCFDGKDLFIDWKISALACYLIVINSDPKYEGVAKAQLWFAMNKASANYRNHQ
jgi:hypothetical protein